MPYYYDWTILLIIPAAIFSFYAQFKVSNTFKKYSKTGNSRGYTGAEVARQLLRYAGITDVSVERVRGSLTDHYDPRDKVLRLSDSVYDSTSIAALGVAAHETGHAVQHDKGYVPLSLRNSVLPVASLGSKMATPLIFLGILLASVTASDIGFLVIQAGIIMFAAVVAFQIITLPVEFNASSRAIGMLDEYGFLTGDEIRPAKRVLSAAAMTYVAAVAVAVANLLRFIVIANNQRKR